MDVTKMKVSELEAYVGGLSKPSKMPWYGYSIPAQRCITGSKLRHVENSVCEHCYALKGMYVFPAVKAALEKRYQSLSKPQWVEVMAELLNRKARGKHQYFRWHDSGDLQSVEHMRNIVLVAESTPGIHHWVPTREYRIVKDYIAKYGKPDPKKIVFRLSVHMIGGFAPKGINMPISTVSRTPMKGAHDCPARNQNNECRDCRACWSPSVKHVDYHLH